MHRRGTTARNSPAFVISKICVRGVKLKLFSADFNGEQSALTGKAKSSTFVRAVASPERLKRNRSGAHFVKIVDDIAKKLRRDGYP